MTLFFGAPTTVRGDYGATLWGAPDLTIWEIGERGADLRELRNRLALDSGYLSRLLRSLEREGMVTVGPLESDRRVRLARRTPAGDAEVAELDRLSDELAQGLLAPLSDRQRTQLLDAVATVERLLTAGMVEIAPADAAGDDVIDDGVNHRFVRRTRHGQFSHGIVRCLADRLELTGLIDHTTDAVGKTRRGHAIEHDKDNRGLAIPALLAARAAGFPDCEADQIFPVLCLELDDEAVIPA